MPIDANVDLTQRKGAKRYQEVFAAICAAIGKGEFQRGARLPGERELARKFGVGRSAIREAMVALEIHGLVEAKQREGLFIVRAASTKSSREPEIDSLALIQARRLCEGEAAALAAATITDAELAQLANLLLEIKASPKPVFAADDATFSFHLAIAQATDNSAIVHVIANLLEMQRRSAASQEMFNRSYESYAVTYPQYLKIYRAVSARDPAAARTALHEHFDRITRYVQLAQGHELLNHDPQERNAQTELMSGVRRTAS